MCVIFPKISFFVQKMPILWVNIKFLQTFKYGELKKPVETITLELIRLAKKTIKAIPRGSKYFVQIFEFCSEFAQVKRARITNNYIFPKKQKGRR